MEEDDFLKKFSLLVLIVTILLSGCKSTIGSEVSLETPLDQIRRTNNSVTKVAEKAVNILDAYINLDITREEANEKFSELKDRAEKMDGTDYEDYDLNDPNQIVLWEIAWIAPIDDWDRDADIIKSRDIIAYHAGLPLMEEISDRSSGMSLADDVTAADYETAVEFMDDYPYGAGRIAYDGDHAVISANFDLQNGVSVDDFCQFSERMIEKSKHTSISGRDVSLIICYRIYGIAVARLKYDRTCGKITVITFCYDKSSDEIEIEDDNFKETLLSMMTETIGSMGK